MKLLLDENLSPRLAPAIRDLFPDVAHVRDVGLQSTDDVAIWLYAAEHGFTIVTKDTDFNQRAFVLGPPPQDVREGLASNRAGSRRVVRLVGVVGGEDQDAVRRLDACDGAAVFNTRPNTMRWPRSFSSRRC